MTKKSCRQTEKVHTETEGHSIFILEQQQNSPGLGSKISVGRVTGYKHSFVTC